MRYVSEFARDGRVLFIACVCVVGAAVAAATPSNWLTWVCAIIGILLFWPVEYAIHRYLLHEFPRLLPKAYAGHVAHHEHPRDTRYLLTPNQFNVPGYIVFAVLAFVVTRRWNLTGAFVAGLSFRQLFYEWKHFVSHRPIVPLTPWGRRMKKRHLLHHYLDAKYWYGVSNATLDYVMGTDIDDEEARRVRHSRGGNLDAELVTAGHEH
ncbi:MAG: sterol desaturase family protein [Alicyclobacillus sp.]|nr:sterol desaturase family protein [Alicyclobacillus sp.]